MAFETSIEPNWDYHVSRIIESWETCESCGEGIFEIEVSEVTDSGAVAYEISYDGPPDRWVEGIVICSCGARNEVIRVM